LFALLAAAALAYHRFVYTPTHTVHGEPAYVLPQNLDVMDTTAEIRIVVGHLKAGDRVEVLARTAHWSEVALRGGQTGWVETKYLLDASTYQRGITLLTNLGDYTPQAAGHTLAATSLRLEPARDSIVVLELPQNQPVEMFERRIVERPVDATTPTVKGTRAHDVWYLVRSNSRAGWLLGRFIGLDVPAGIETYAQGINVVAWLVLKTVDDGGNQVPEYLVADRMGGGDADFSHIRVFTWWVKNHRYVTAYVENGLDGYFPIKVAQLRDPSHYAELAPYFRLRLIDQDSHRYQKVYGLFDTITRSVGTVEGWDSNAVPTRVPQKERVERQNPRHRTGR
jgi:Bacterial SH3 domain